MVEPRNTSSQKLYKNQFRTLLMKKPVQEEGQLHITEGPQNWGGGVFVNSKYLCCFLFYVVIFILYQFRSR